MPTIMVDAPAQHSDAPSFIEPLSYAVLGICAVLIVIGVLYGLNRWGEPPEPNEQQSASGPYHTGYAGARGWTGAGAGAGSSEAAEMHRLLDVHEEDEDEGDTGSEATAVEGNLPSSSAAPSAAGRWKLRTAGFSSTAAPESAKKKRGSRTTRPAGGININSAALGHE